MLNTLTIMWRLTCEDSLYKLLSVFCPFVALYLSLIVKYIKYQLNYCIEWAKIKYHTKIKTFLNWINKDKIVFIIGFHSNPFTFHITHSLMLSSMKMWLKLVKTVLINWIIQCFYSVMFFNHVLSVDLICIIQSQLTKLK